MKQININSKISVKDFGEQIQFKLIINQSVGKELGMGLLLLKENLSNVIGLKFSDFLMILKTSDDNYSYIESIEFKNKIFKGMISFDAIDYILYYVLKFYRDGIAEAEHIDVDFINIKGAEITFTIQCNDYIEYSAEEINNILR